MKQVLQLLARLYPAEWRARYGAEYAALLEDREPHWRDVADVAWAAVKLWAASWSLIRVVLPCVIAGGLVAVAAAWVKPVQYTSGTLVVESIPVYADSAGDLKPVAGGESQTPQLPELARKAFADQEAMARIIEKYNLYPRERAKLPLDAVIETMRSAIRVRPVWGSALDQDIELAKQMPGLDPASIDRNKKFIRAGFTVQFKYPDPHVAQSVNAELLSHLVRANLRSAEDSAQAGRPRIPTTFSVLYAPNLPEKPDRLNWIELGAMGLVGGLGSGLMLAAMVRMRRGRIAATGLVLLGMLGGGATRGQDVVHGSGPLPSFEVATIKPIHEGVPPLLAWPPPNVVRTIGGTARDLVRNAFGLPPGTVSARVFGGPGWIDNDRYDIEGKIPDSIFVEIQKLPPREQGKQKSLMLQALMADRFKLKVHFETREMPIYELVVAKGGPKLTPAKEVSPADSDKPLPPPSPGNPPRPDNMRQGLMVLRKGPGVMEMTAKGQTLDALAQQPFFGLGSPVVNKTGLTDKYDFVLDWSPDQSTAPVANGLDAPTDAPALFTAVQEQLGLKLVQTKGPVEVIVIDHIEMPSEN